MNEDELNSEDQLIKADWVDELIHELQSEATGTEAKPQPDWIEYAVDFCNGEMRMLTSTTRIAVGSVVYTAMPSERYSIKAWKVIQVCNGISGRTDTATIYVRQVALNTINRKTEDNVRHVLPSNVPH